MELLARDDKKKAAVHEAGHVVVAAIADDMTLGAWIDESRTNDPRNDSIWIGQTHGLTWGRVLSPAMSIAGRVAESLFIDDDYFDIEDMLVQIAEDENFLSPTDREIFPEDYAQQVEAINQARVILENNRPFVEWVVKELLAECAVTDYQVTEYLKSQGRCNMAETIDASSIKQHHCACREAICTALGHAIAAGELLTKAKSDCRRGDWTPFLRDVIPDSANSSPTANNYMRLAAIRESIEDKMADAGNFDYVALLLRKAIRYLAPPTK
jgi:hypothetical protein